VPSGIMGSKRTSVSPREAMVVGVFREANVKSNGWPFRAWVIGLTKRFEVGITWLQERVTILEGGR